MKVTGVFLLVGFVALSSQAAEARSLGGGNVRAVSEVLIMAVQSPLGGHDDTEGRTSTRVHHGGAYVRVTTIERGMGRASATMNGASLRELKSVNVCDRGLGFWVACRNGQIVEGRLRVWDATGKGNGTFSVRVTSSDWPRNTVARSLSLW